MNDIMPVPGDSAPPARWPGVEVHWNRGRRYLLVTLREEAEQPAVLAALGEKAVGLELMNVSPETAELLFRVPPNPAWRDAVDGISVL